MVVESCSYEERARGFVWDRFAAIRASEMAAKPQSDRRIRRRPYSNSANVDWNLARDQAPAAANQNVSKPEAS
jgi:hypothetical protein